MVVWPFLQFPRVFKSWSQYKRRAERSFIYPGIGNTFWPFPLHDTADENKIILTVCMKILNNTNVL